MRGFDGQRIVAMAKFGANRRIFLRGAPGPGVAKPKRREHMQRRGLIATIGDGDADEEVVGVGFGVFEGDVEVAAVVEDAGVGDFEFGIEARAGAVGFDQRAYGNSAWGYL